MGVEFQATQVIPNSTPAAVPTPAQSTPVKAATGGIFANAASLEEKKAVLAQRGLIVNGNITNISEQNDPNKNTKVVTISSNNGTVTLNSDALSNPSKYQAKHRPNGASININDYGAELFNIKGATVTSPYVSLESCSNSNVTAPYAFLNNTTGTTVQLAQNGEHTGGTAGITGGENNTILGTAQLDQVNLFETKFNNVSTGDGDDYVTVGDVGNKNTAFNTINTGKGHDYVRLLPNAIMNTIDTSFGGDVVDIQANANGNRITTGVGDDYVEISANAERNKISDAEQIRDHSWFNMGNDY